MYASMLKEHLKSQEQFRNEINSKRVSAEKAIECWTGESVMELNNGIAQAYLNQHKLDNEVRKLQSNVCKLTKQVQQWMIVCNSLNGAVKDIGDVSTWTKTIQKDIKYVASAIEELNKPQNNEN